ncbi:hypothetical protein [Lacticaseibacillus thailandensis]|uniref:hypothetical protein n=1 Tax=Lacticaseibacillus thailandensis TaxID=381741 RepID=UPI0012E9369F|nr:hypothetical protein [Lacticaseibacillus thailandensis]
MHLIQKNNTGTLMAGRLPSRRVEGVAKYSGCSDTLILLGLHNESKAKKALVLVICMRGAN